MVPEKIMKNKQSETFELRQCSEEVQEIMGQKPRALVLWGNILLILLIVSFFVANMFVTFTEVRSFPMTMQEGGMSIIQVPANDITKLKLGQPMQINMEIYPQETYGQFAGRVMRVNPIPDEQGYSVTLKVDSVTDMGKRPILIAGMRGTASLEMSGRGFLRSLLMNRKN